MRNVIMGINLVSILDFENFDTLGLLITNNLTLMSNT
jgi:hypothetical protein